MDWSQLEQSVRTTCGVTLITDTAAPVAGGDINAAYRCETDSGLSVFLKVNSRDNEDFFVAEADGLQALADAGVAVIPEVIGQGVTDEHAWLMLEYLPLASPSASSDRALGAALAELHEQTSEQHGWHRNNWIGASPQQNAPSPDWVTFYGSQRLSPQLDLARGNGAERQLLDATEAVIECLPQILAGHAPAPSLLHGDLWSGNRAALPDGRPVLLDPAVHCGDGECDLAMTRLFGGFGAGFYDAYHERLPQAPGHELRQDLYQLYHVLNHFNLFGGGYGNQALRLCSRLLASVG
jgi:protein-ribulosamine 3-kinase